MPCPPSLLRSAADRLRSATDRAARFVLPADARVAVLAGALLGALWQAVLGWALMIAVYAPLVWALARSLRPFGRGEVVALPA